MIDFSTLSKGFLEQKIASGELSIIKPKKQEQLFDYTKEDLIKARSENVCPYHYLPLKEMRNGNLQCPRVIQRATKGKKARKCGFFMRKK